MPTKGQAISFKANVNLYVSMGLIASFSLACALILWHAAFNNNPVADLLTSSVLIAEREGY